MIDALVHSVTISDLPDDDGNNTHRRLQIVYNLTDNNASTLDLGADAFGCSADSSTISRPSEHLRIIMSAGVFILDATIRAPV